MDREILFLNARKFIFVLCMTYFAGDVVCDCSRKSSCS